MNRGCGRNRLMSWLRRTKGKFNVFMAVAHIKFTEATLASLCFCDVELCWTFIRTFPVQCAV